MGADGFTWYTLDSEIVLIGALGAMACALLGNFLVLRRMSMMGDAISHAVLPGLAIAFLLSGSRDTPTMFLGAALAGVLTAALTHWVHRLGRVDQNAAMGVVFTTLFAVGLILIVRAADTVDLDPGCVLYGSIELAPLDRLRLFGLDLPRALVNVGLAFGLNAIVVAALYKEFKLCAFDPSLATAQGINASLMHYLLMILTAVTTVAAFESVGSILVIAMLIVPPAAAYLLTDRLHVMILLSLVIAAASAALGHLSAITVPTWFGFPDTTTAGMMAVGAGAWFTLALLAAPRHGLISRLCHRLALTLRIAREDALGLVYRLGESGTRPAPETVRDLLRKARGVGPLTGRLVLASLGRRGLLHLTPEGYRLTELGRTVARGLLRSHRLWETYLERHAVTAPGASHFAAEQFEHVTDAEMQSDLAAGTAQPNFDPHGHPIPPPETTPGKP